MVRTAAVASLLLVAAPAIAAQPQSPQAYALKAVAHYEGMALTVTLARDGARERVEQVIAGRVLTTLYDFERHRVHWIGLSGPEGCSSGRYGSARAPFEEDPVTGTADHLAKLERGLTREPAGTDRVAGLPARVERFVGAKRPTGQGAAPQPTRVWLAAEGGYLLKLEGVGTDGKAVTLYEVTQLTFGRPAGARLDPPTPCVATNSEMDDTGLMRAHGESNATAEVSATADLGTGATSATATQVSTTSTRPPPAGPLAKIGALSVGISEQADGGPCGKKLELTATIAVDGPASLWVKLVPSVGGLQFPEGQIATLSTDGSGSATVVRTATFSRPLAGQLRVQAMVQGTKGHNGPLKSSDPVPLDVGCSAR